MLTRYRTQKIVRTTFLILVAFIVVSYGIFVTHDFILGPTISFMEPANGSSFDTPSIKIKGVVKRIQDVNLNGRSITIDDKGNFTETVLLAPGYNVFSFIARDKFGRSKDYRLELVYKVN